MKRLGSFAALAALSLAALPALAQQTPGPAGPGPMYGYPHMWAWEGGWHATMVLWPFVMLLALIGIVALVAWLVRAFTWGSFHHGHSHHCCRGFGRERDRAALDILEERFARGEIGKDEFEEKRKLLGH